MIVSALASSAGMVEIVKQVGHERILINSAADWGVSDPLKVPKTVAAMRAAGISDDAIHTIVWSNPYAFFAQSGRLDVPDDCVDVTVFDRHVARARPGGLPG